MSGWGQGASACGTLHLDIHPALQALVMEEVVAGRDHARPWLPHLSRVHADHTLTAAITRFNICWCRRRRVQDTLCNLPWHNGTVVVILGGKEPLWHKPAGPPSCLQEQHNCLRRQPSHQDTAEHQVWGLPHDIVGATIEVQGQQQPGDAHANDIKRPQRLPSVCPCTVHDLRDPETVHQHQDHRHDPASNAP